MLRLDYVAVGVLTAVVLLPGATRAASASYGVTGGVTYSTHNYGDFEPGTGIHIGGFVELFGQGVVSLLVEANYVEHILTTTRTGSDIQLGYVSVPILAKLSARRLSVALYGTLGARVDIRVGAESTRSDAARSDPLANYLVSRAARTVWRGTVGAGLELSRWSPAPIVETRFSFEMTEAFPVPTHVLEMRNNVLEVVCGIRF